MKKHNPATIAPPAGAYSMGVSAPGGGRWLHIAGQVGIDRDGRTPEGCGAQAEIAWSNLLAILADAGMGVEHLVKVNHYLVDSADVAAYGAVRSRFLGEARPASTLVIVQALVKPEWRIEVEAVAWCPQGGA